MGIEASEDKQLNLDVTRAHGARIYDYILGGKDNYAPDRDTGNAALQAWPALRGTMHANRAFMHRAARFLATERDIGQFLDIGTGLPATPNLHEVVQAVTPEARIAYVDNDPLILAHARALMTSTPEGRTTYIDGDLRDPDAILAAPRLRETLDLNKPTALFLIGMLHFIEDDDEALRVARHVIDALPSGSYVAATIATDDYAPEPLAKVRDLYHSRGETLQWRTKAQAQQFFKGLELEEPGLVQIHKWHPCSVDIGRINDADIAMYGAVGRKR
ncbi:SAM-dependent methyltransferase [Nocardia vaccinii]|uniref:SAM-dependent methyltransferase n=1 Tax=Nocardia vaccinii TaxID=1822 RepID=UPI000A4C0B39|nr:SAM-dependent methyltransferase [Nocardia vaccinii]